MPNPVKAFTPLLLTAQASPNASTVAAVAAAWPGYPADFIGYELDHLREHITAADGEATVLPEARAWLQEMRDALGDAQADAASGGAITTYGALVTDAQATPDQAHVDALVDALDTFHADYRTEVVGHFVARLEEEEIANTNGPPGRRKPASRAWSANLRSLLSPPQGPVVLIVARAIAPEPVE